MKKLLVFTAGILLFTAPSFAEAPQPFQRTISVSGQAEEQVAPDQAILSMSLVSKDKNLSVAKKNNDAMVERLVKIAQEYKIPQAKIVTSNISINPEYNYTPNGQPQFIGYIVSRSLRVTMDTLDIHEKVLSSIVDAKIDQVNGVEFQLAKPAAHSAALRVKAFEDAKAKALALAQAAGSKLGPALTISTAGEMPPFPPRPMAMMSKAMDAGGAEMSVAPSLPGTVTLHESVSVVFGLE